MTYDESNARLTEALTGRTIEYLYREGKMLHIVTTDGHDIALQSDVNHDIHFKSMGVKIYVNGVSFSGIADEL